MRVGFGPFRGRGGPSAGPRGVALAASRAIRGLSAIVLQRAELVGSLMKEIAREGSQGSNDQGWRPIR